MNPSSGRAMGTDRVFRRADTGLVVHVRVEEVEPIFPSDGRAIRISVTVPNKFQIDAITAMVLHVDWQAPNKFDTGVGVLGRARIDVSPYFHGCGIGSLAMSLGVGWLKGLTAVPLSPIILDALDATPDNAVRRTRFYERFGITFAWEEVDVAGQAFPMSTHGLKVPDDDAWIDLGSLEDPLESGN